MSRLRLSLAASFLLLSSTVAPALTIQINAGSGLAGNAPALAAFQRAAQHWSDRLTDAITVNVDADLAPLGTGVIGSAGSSILYGDDYAEMRDALVREAALDPDDAITASLPTFAQINVNLPAGRSLDDTLAATKANVKAIVVDDPLSPYTPALIDSLFGATDATITFSSNFSFDFDRSDGITSGTMDFETVAAHEIGHALGFISAVDDIDTTTSGNLPVVALTLLDLYRFRVPDDVPGSASAFTTATRSAIPGEAAGFSDTVNLWSFATGQNGGDGNQASHWKDDSLTFSFIGLLDPTLPFGAIEDPTEADFRALDLIGWNVVSVPEPALGGLLAAASVLGFRRRRA